MVGLILKSAVVMIGCLIAGDIAGVIFLAFIEILPFALFSTALTYIVWFVFGIFTGLFAYNYAGAWGAQAGEGRNWTQHPQAKEIGWVIVAIQAAVIVGLGCLFYRIYWSQGVAGEYYVPDSAPHSITYFVAVLGAIIVARFMLMPTPDTPKSGIR